MPRPSTFLDWNGTGMMEPSPAQKASGFAVSQKPPAESVNWLLVALDSWNKYVDDYLNVTFPALKAPADAAASQGAIYPMRELAQASATVFTSIAAAVDANGALLHLLAIGVAGKTVRIDQLAFVTIGTWGVATDCNDVAYGNGRYLGCGATGAVRTSTDGSAWGVYHSVGGSSILYSVAYSADRILFCAVGSDNAGTNGITVAGNGLAAATARGLPNPTDIPRRVVWVGGSIQAFFAFSLTKVYSSPNPQTDAWVEVGSYSAFTTILDACWHPTLGIFVLGVLSNNLRYVRSTTGLTGSWTSYQSGYTVTPINASIVALPDGVYVVVSNGSAYSCAAYRLIMSTLPDPQAECDARYVLPAKPQRVKVLHNGIYCVGTRSATDSSIYAGAALEALRSYSRG